MLLLCFFFSYFDVQNSLICFQTTHIVTPKRVWYNTEGKSGTIWLVDINAISIQWFYTNWQYSLKTDHDEVIYAEEWRYMENHQNYQFGRWIFSKTNNLLHKYYGGALLWRNFFRKKEYRPTSCIAFRAKIEKGNIFRENV